MFQLNILIKYQFYTILHVVHLINKLPTPLLQNKIPHGYLYHKPSNYQYLKVFGSLYFASTLFANKTKFDNRAKKCVFLGFKLAQRDMFFQISRIGPYSFQDIFPSMNISFSFNLPLLTLLFLYHKTLLFPLMKFFLFRPLNHLHHHYLLIFLLHYLQDIQ